MIDCNEQTDEEIMGRVLDNRDYFGCLIDRYDKKMRRYIKRIMPGIGDDEDDLLQDIFIKAYINSQSFDTSLKFSSWLYRIAHNESVSWLRKKKSRPETVELGEDDFHIFAKSIDISFGSKENELVYDEVTRILSDMPIKYRNILVLRFLEGKNYEEISDILRVPGGTVATLIHRAKKHFSNIYNKHHE